MVRIYLSGSIKKGDGDSRPDDYFWTSQNEQELTSRINHEVELLNPAKTPISRNGFYINYGCDLYLVSISSVVVADLRRSKGIGVGAELMYANLHGIPVIGWLPPDSEYKRDLVKNINGEDLIDWVHPFAFGLCDMRFETLAEIGFELEMMIKTHNFKKSYRSPQHSIDKFLERYPDFEKND
jgi:hypothetical protein